MAELADLIRPGAGRGLDFVIVDELRKRTGIVPEEILKFAIGEMIANALDTDATKIFIETRTVGQFDEVTMRDNGTKQISLKEFKLILDFSNKASSKRGFLRVSRGYLGNALKCLFGYSYALAEYKRGLTPPEILINSHGTEYQINLKPDRVKEVIDYDVSVKKAEDTGFNSFTLRFPIYRAYPGESAPILESAIIYSIIFATSIVNPTRKFVYSLWETSGELGEEAETPPLRRDTSILWYEPKQFQDLFYDFVRASPETKLKDLIALFRGFTGKSVIGEILHDLNGAGNHDSGDNTPVQFFPATHIGALSPDHVERLYWAIRKRGKPIAKRSVPQVLGIVGEKMFERVKKQHGWKRLRYTVMKGLREEGGEAHLLSRRGTASFPFLIELAVYDRQENDDRGLQVFQCVNFAASMEDIFSPLFSIKYRLGRVGITEESPVTVVVHLVCPVLKWLNYGKSGLYE